MSANSGIVSRVASTQVGSLSIPNVLNYQIASPNTEESFVLPNNTKFFRLQSIGNYVVYLSYAPLATEFFTIYPNATHEISGIAATSVTIYVRSPGTPKIEVETWS